MRYTKVSKRTFEEVFAGIKEEPITSPDIKGNDEESKQNIQLKFVDKGTQTDPEVYDLNHFVACYMRDSVSKLLQEAFQEQIDIPKLVRYQEENANLKKMVTAFKVMLDSYDKKRMNAIMPPSRDGGLVYNCVRCRQKTIDSVETQTYPYLNETSMQPFGYEFSPYPPLSSEMECLSHRIDHHNVENSENRLPRVSSHGTRQDIQEQIEPYLLNMNSISNQVPRIVSQGSLAGQYEVENYSSYNPYYPTIYQQNYYQQRAHVPDYRIHSDYNNLYQGYSNDNNDCLSNYDHVINNDAFLGSTIESNSSYPRFHSDWV